MSVEIHFLPDDVFVQAETGEPILEAAKRAGVFIPTGCLMGSCHACEVELEDGSNVCSCICSVPLKSKSLKVYTLNDPAW
jgi:ferredoxin